MKKLFILLFCCLFAATTVAQTQKKSTTSKTTTAKTATAKKATTAKKTATTAAKATTTTAKKSTSTAKKTTTTKKATTSTAKKTTTSTAKKTPVTTSTTETKATTTAPAKTTTTPTSTASESHATAHKTSVSKKQSNNTFGKGKMLVNGGIGLGIQHSKGHTGCMFNQKVSFEYGIAQINKNNSLSIGAAISNSWGDRADGMITGTYNYEYSYKVYAREFHNGVYRNVLVNHGTTTRQGVGTANCKISSDDIKIMLTTSFHHQFKSNLEGYATFGLGVGIFNAVYGSKSNLKGFDSAKSPTTEEIKDKTAIRLFYYSYDDLDHAKFEKQSAKAAFAMAACVGCRYYVTDHLGIYGEVGLPSSMFRKAVENIDLLSVGCSYKF